MCDAYYAGIDPDLLDAYAKAKDAYSRHIFYCDECRAYLAALTEIALAQQLPDDVDARLEAWARERGVSDNGQ